MPNLSTPFDCFRQLPAAIASVLLCCVYASSAQTPAPIPESRISALQHELAEGARGTSMVEIRRTYKNVIRKAEALLAESPGAPNRFALLAVVLDGQKRLLSLEATESNRAAIYATCAQLCDAPNVYAEPRFDADIILSEKELSEANAAVAERVAALEEMLVKYRGTAAEWKSLRIGSLIAAKLLDFDLEKQISDTMAERFGADPKVISFRREKDAGATVDAVFGGTYMSSDGKTIIFPYDRIGHQYVLYFWSEITPDIDKHLAAIKAFEEEHRDRLEFYSFNVDELPDAGEKKLRAAGVDWPAMHLPGGRKSAQYMAYAMGDPLAVFVNGQGHVRLKPPPNTPKFDWHGRRILPEDEVFGGRNLPDIAHTLDNDRYLAQLRYLFIGDYLVAGTPASQGVPDETLAAIQSCFTLPPFRYRLTRAASLASYTKAEKICAAAMKTHATAGDLQVVRNRRIIALIGMWNLSGEPQHLEEAVREANGMLGIELPSNGDVVARFCLAKQALRNGGDPEAVLADMIEQAGGDTAPPAAVAAAAILALEANARTAHEAYRRRLLDVEVDGDPMLWPVYAFLRDDHHRYRNFWASPGGFGFSRPQKYESRNMVSGLMNPVDRSFSLELELTGGDGGAVMISAVAKGEMLGLIFAEPPVDSGAQSNLINRVRDFAARYAKSGVPVAVAVLSPDANAVRAVANGVGDGVQVGMVPGGLTHPLVRKLGILSADRMPNLLLLRPDGTRAWTVSGLQYRAFRPDFSHAMGNAIDSNILKVRSDVPFEALERGDYKEALQLFDAVVPPAKGTDWWMADRYHGMAMAHMGLNQWEKALIEINRAIDQRLTDFKSGICKCHGMVEMYLTKAMILDRLDRGPEAAEQRGLAAKQSVPHGKIPPDAARQGVPVGVYYDWLKRIRLGLE